MHSVQSFVLAGFCVVAASAAMAGPTARLVGQEAVGASPTTRMVGEVVADAAVALSSPVYLAGTVAANQDLHLVKECSHFDGKPGTFCQITDSSFAAIPVGSKIFYYGPVIGPAILSTAIVLDAGDGNTAIGNCSVEPNKNYGTCTFWAGSGTLRGFQALVTLSPVDGNAAAFHWDGFYDVVTY